MSIFSGFFRKRKSLPVIERKSYGGAGGFISFLRTYGQSDLECYAAIQLYNMTAPLQNAVEIISREISSLIPVLKSKKNGEVIREHPVLELLRAPNADSSGIKFLASCANFFLITGNNYWSAVGNIARDPLEVWNLYPQATQPYADVKDGFAAYYTLQEQSGHIEYKRSEVKGRFRYYSQDDLELWHLKRFNPNVGSLTGQSLSTSLLSEIDQFNYASVHNVSLLKRGARPSGILLVSGGTNSEGVPVGGLTDEQFNRLRTQFGRYMGAENSGKVFIADGVKVDYKDMLVSNRDMDWMEGRKDVRQSIYTHYSIPLPLISGNRQTFSNLDAAGAQLYDAAVLPFANMIFMELSLFLMPRYKDGDKYELTYDDTVIPALRKRKTAEIKEKQSTGIYTINELRTMAGKESLDQGGDQLYRPSNMVPVAMDLYTDDQLSKPNVDPKRFREILLRKGYSEDKINEMSAILRLGK